MDPCVVREAVRFFVEEICAFLPCPRHSYLRIHGAHREYDGFRRDLLRVYRNTLAFIPVVGHGWTRDRHLERRAVRKSTGPNPIPRVTGCPSLPTEEGRSRSHQKSEQISTIENDHGLPLFLAGDRDHTPLKMISIQLF
jgi:hypothetical protein